MGSMFDMIEEINLQLEGRLMSSEFVQTSSEQCGLDPRACYRMYVSEECVVIPKHADSRMQYYGGFEYIDPEARTEIGSYVVYFTLEEDDRVGECISRVFSDIDG